MDRVCGYSHRTTTGKGVQMTEVLPNAKYEGSVTIAGITLKTYVLDDGRAIIDCDGVNKLLAYIEAGGELSMEAAVNLIDVKAGRTVMKDVTPSKDSKNE
jgi:hypothetical protein